MSYSMKIAFLRYFYAFSNSILSSTTSKLPLQNCNRKTVDILSKNLASLATQNVSEKKEIKIKFIKDDGKTVEVKANAGDDVCDIGIKHNILEVDELCRGMMACPDCHVILTEKDYKKLPRSHEEDDDVMNYIEHYTKTSRMSCQIKITDDLDGMELKVPKKQEPPTFKY